MSLLDVGLVILTVLFFSGVIYPFLMTGLAQVFLHDQANGSLIKVNGQAQVHALVTHYTSGRDLGMPGVPRVNVLELNLALDRLKK